MNIHLIITGVELLLGAVVVFSGANLLRNMPPLGGFILGGLVGMNVATFVSGTSPINLGLGFVFGGIAGALIAIPLQIIIVILSSSALGVLAGAILGFLIGQEGVSKMIVYGIFSRPQGLTSLQVWLMALGGLVFGALSVRFDEGMLILSTGFLGSFAVIGSLTQLIGFSSPILSNSIFQFFGWAALGLIGAIWQNYNRGD